MDNQRIIDLIRYILAEADQDEDWSFRELGPIHIIKYVYLADMYYATRNDGKTFTGIDWQFYHFGPWSLELYKEIPNAIKIIGADTRTFESHYEKDGQRFSLKEYNYDESSDKIPLSIGGLLGRDIHNFGSATSDLLHYVYTTPPMTNAVPGERLDFSHVVFIQQASLDKENPPKLTTGAAKKSKQHILDVREKIAKKREVNKKKRIRPAPPRYDEVFFRGTMALDIEFENPPIENHDGLLRVNIDAWYGNWRRNHDLP